MAAVDPPDVWRDIAERASTLSERLAAFRIDGAGNAPVDPAVSRIWAKVAALGNDAQFRRRLHAMDISSSDLPACLAQPDLRGTELPTWCQLLADAAVTPTEPLIRDRLLDQAPEALPDLLSPLVSIAVTELIGRHGELLDLDRTPLLGDLTGYLQQTLAELVKPCVAAELQGARLSADDTSSDTWSTWMAGQVRSGLIGFWIRYPALARLVGTAMELWVTRSAELLARAAIDVHLLNERFGTRLVRIHRATLGLSDNHQGRATVVDCRFIDAEGQQRAFIYKPKDITTEAVFADLCTWLNASGADLGEPLQVLSMRGYGWVEKATSETAASKEETTRYFRRCGSLAALLFALGGVDFHAENLVAHGDTPLIIDAETVLHPGLPDEGGGAGSEPEPGSQYRHNFSVLDTYVMPRWTRAGDKAVDLSALGTAEDGCQPRTPALEWLGAGTADARLVTRQDAGLQRNSDLVEGSGRIARASDHAGSLLAGFEQAWSLMAACGAQGDEGNPFAGDGPLRGFTAAPVRAVVRPTSWYVRLLRESMTPTLLTDGLHRSIFLERLSRYAVARQDGGESFAMVDTEREQLEIGDIPIFTIPGAALEITDHRGARIVLFRESAVQQAARRIESMNPAELDRQRRYLRASLAVAQPRARLVERAAQTPGAPMTTSLAGAESEEIRTAACQELLDRVYEAIEHSGDPSSIAGLTAVSTEQWGISPIDSAMCDGAVGLAVAVLAGAKTLTDPRAEETATSILRPAIADTVNRIDRLMQIRGLGAERGIGGRLFGMAVCHRLSTASASIQLIDQGLAELVSRISPTRRDVRQANDLFGGRLGLLAGLLATESVGIAVPTNLMESTIESVCLDLAETQRLTPRSGRRSGYPHGESGMAVILSEVRSRGLADRPTLDGLISECLASERERFDPRVASGSTTAGADMHPFAGGPGWCNGLPGIALARAGIITSWPTNDSAALEGDLRLALPALMQSTLTGDMLCCGAAGQVEVLRRVTKVLQDGAAADWIDLAALESARATATAELAHRTVNDRLRLGIPRDSPLTALGLYVGISGVLYALSAASPGHDLPSLLSWRLDPN